MPTCAVTKRCGGALTNHIRGLFKCEGSHLKEAVSTMPTASITSLHERRGINNRLLLALSPATLDRILRISEPVSLSERTASRNRGASRSSASISSTADWSAPPRPWKTDGWWRSQPLALRAPQNSSPCSAWTGTCGYGRAYSGNGNSHCAQCLHARDGEQRAASRVDATGECASGSAKLPGILPVIDCIISINDAAAGS